MSSKLKLSVQNPKDPLRANIIPAPEAPLQYSDFALLTNTTASDNCNYSYNVLSNPCAIPYSELVKYRGGYVYGQDPQRR